MKTPVHRLRVGDTWTEHGHTRRVTSRPQPRGDGSYTFTTELVPSGAPETHVLPADRELETAR